MKTLILSLALICIMRSQAFGEPYKPYMPKNPSYENLVSDINRTNEWVYQQEQKELMRRQTRVMEQNAKPVQIYGW